jgi:hypothetical protein
MEIKVVILYGIFLKLQAENINKEISTKKPCKNIYFGYTQNIFKFLFKFWVYSNFYFLFFLPMLHDILHQSLIVREKYIAKIFHYWNAPIIKVITGMRRT